MKQQNKAAEFTLSDSDVVKLINAATSSRNRLIIKTLVQTGLRRAELADLDVEDLQPERSRLLVRHGKGDKARIVPCATDLIAELRAYVQRRKTGPLFVSSRGRLSLRSVSYIVETAGKHAGISNPNPKRRQINAHLLRHTFSRHFLRDGGRVHILSQILGHESIAITHACYGSASEEEIQSEYQKIFSRGE